MIKNKDIKQCIADKLAVPFDRLKPKARLIEDLGADSLDMVELAMDLENKFNYTEDDAKSRLLLTSDNSFEYWNQWKTVKDVIEGVKGIKR